MEPEQTQVADLAIEIGGLLFEIRLAAHAIHLGLESLPDKRSAAVLLTMSSQLLDALECLQQAMMSRLE
jgi:hypothetical protein